MTPSEVLQLLLDVLADASVVDPTHDGDFANQFVEHQMLIDNIKKRITEITARARHDAE